MEGLRKKIVELAYKAKEGHLGSSLSVLDIIWILYDRVLGKKHVFILSKGHAALALYVVLAQKGKITQEELESYCQYNSLLGGHPKRGGAITASTGSLGHGLPMAVGMAMGFRAQRVNKRVYCLIGDGECNEGSIWESALIATHHQLNIFVIVDQNKSSERALSMGSIADKFRAFGWPTIEIDGHDHKELQWALRMENDAPTAIIAKTIKGHGISFMENNPEWHHKIPNKEEYEKAIH